MISIGAATAYCCEDISKIENYDKAIVDKTQTWHCHHRRETDEHKSAAYLINHGLYYNQPAKDLIFLTPTEHGVVHHTKPIKQIKKLKRLANEKLVRDLLLDNVPINKILKILNEQDTQE